MQESNLTTPYRNGEIANGHSDQHVGLLVQDLTDRCDALERERDELCAQLARLEPSPKRPRSARSMLANLLFGLLASLVIAAAGIAIAIASGLWDLDPAPDQNKAAPAAAPAEAAPTPTSSAQTEPRDSVSEPSVSGGAPVAGVGEAGATEGGGGAGGAAPVALMARANGGECWLQVRRGDETGKVVWEGILPKGDSVSFEGKRVWLRVGDPSVLRLVLNGEVVENLPKLAADLLATPSGVRVITQG